VHYPGLLKKNYAKNSNSENKQSAPPMKPPDAELTVSNFPEMPNFLELKLEFSKLSSSLMEEKKEKEKKEEVKSRGWFADPHGAHFEDLAKENNAEEVEEKKEKKEKKKEETNKEKKEKLQEKDHEKKKEKKEKEEKKEDYQLEFRNKITKPNKNEVVLPIVKTTAEVKAAELSSEKKPSSNDKPSKVPPPKTEESELEELTATLKALNLGKEKEKGGAPSPPLPSTSKGPSPFSPAGASSSSSSASSSSAAATATATGDKPKFSFFPTQHKQKPILWEDAKGQKKYLLLFVLLLSSSSSSS